MDTNTLYVITKLTPAVRPSDETLATPDTDQYGRTIFRADYAPVPVPANLITDSLKRYIAAIHNVLTDAAALAPSFQIKDIKIKLAIDAKFGCALVGEGGAEAAIEVTLSRETTNPSTATAD